jgi:hypothetical protein
MGCHLAAHLACLLLRFLGPISPTPHHIVALALYYMTKQHTHTCCRFLPLISYRSNLLASMNRDETEELYPAALPHVLRQRDLGFCSRQQCDLRFCSGSTSDVVARPTI